MYTTKDFHISQIGRRSGILNMGNLGGWSEKSKVRKMNPEFFSDLENLEGGEIWERRGRLRGC